MGKTIIGFDCAREYRIAAANCRTCFYGFHDKQNSHPDLVYTTDNQEEANENAMNALQNIKNFGEEHNKMIAEGALKFCKKEMP